MVVRTNRTVAPNRGSSTIAAAAPAAAGLTIICALPEEFAAEGPDKCLTFHIAGCRKVAP